MTSTPPNAVEPAPFSLSDEQCDAVVAVENWLGEDNPGVFRLFGYAGTGKTTLAREMAFGLNAAFCAFTGKAASRLRAKGCTEATTVHGLLYARVDEIPDSPANVLLRKLAKEDIRYHVEDDRIITKPKGIEQGLRDEINGMERALVDELKRREADPVYAGKAKRAGSRLAFTLKPQGALDKMDLIVLDECSMISRPLWIDLLGFGRPILCLGDPGQLPPIEGTSPILERAPDILLEQIHRQAEGSGILDLATAVRKGDRPTTFGEGVRRFRWAQDEHLCAADQVLCGTNRTRIAINKKMRAIYKHGGVIPKKGEKVVCLRNNHDIGIMNGEMFRVVEDATQVGQIVDMEIVPDDAPEDAPSRFVHADASWFETGQPGQFAGRDLCQFDYGYAITTHKAQGSEWDSVLVMDESRFFKEHADKWLYTAVSRAKKELAWVGG